MPNIEAQFANNKIVIIGAGNVGTTTAFALISSQVVSEITLIDINEDKAEGEVLDLRDGLPFLQPININTGDYSACRDADIIIISAGFNQEPGETRLDLTEKNISVFSDILPQVLAFNPSPLLLIATNPVDVLTHYSINATGLSPDQVLGSGTVLDSSRLRYALSSHCKVDPRSIHGYVIGEHGDGAVIVWSTLQIGGMKMEEYCQICQTGCPPLDHFDAEVKEAAYNIISKKGATYYSIALALKRIVESILRDENSILTVSSYISEYYGINDICLSLPSIINQKGREALLPIPLNDSEITSLQDTATKLKDISNNFLYDLV